MLRRHFVTLSYKQDASRGLKKLFAQVEVEVTAMANREQTRLERDIAIIEQTLRAMIEIDSAVARMPADDAQQSSEHATLMR